MIDGVLHKKCPHCRETKPHSEYAKNKSRAHGIQSICKLCGTERSKKWNANNAERHRENVRKWESQNAERVAETSKRYYETHREQKRDARSKWYQANKDKVSVRGKQRQKEKADHIRAIRKEYLKANPHVMMAINSRRRANKKCATKPFDLELFSLVENEVFALVKMREACTGIKWSVDHLVPITSPRRQSLSGDTVPKHRFCGPTLPVVQGFHNEFNLSVVTAFENGSKSNRYWPDM
jgi:hypothetical protein